MRITCISIWRQLFFCRVGDVFDQQREVLLWSSADATSELILSESMHSKVGTSSQVSVCARCCVKLLLADREMIPCCCAVSRCGVGGAGGSAGERGEGAGSCVSRWRSGAKYVTYRRWWWVQTETLRLLSGWVPTLGHFHATCRATV